MEDIIDIIVTETTNLITITSSGSDEVIDVNIIDNREDIVLNVTPSVVEININSLTGNFGVNWGQITGTLSNQTDLNTTLGLKADLVGGKVPSSQLPSYVDDVVEVANYAALPATGETGKIYITLDTNFMYRWSGSTYIEIKDSSAVWGAITGTLSSQTDLQNALNAKFDDPSGDTTQYIAGDGSLITFPVAGQAGTLVREVRNTTGATLTKGTIVYISGATGNKPTVSKAIATGDSTLAQTFGMCQANISNNSNGYVVCVGDITGLDTSALTEGQQLYLSGVTAGAYTTTKSVAPIHLVYIGVVIRSHPTLGQIEVKIQNGYELDEIHDVLITSKANNDGLFYESSTSLWKNKSIATVLGYSPEQPLTFSSPLSRATNAVSIPAATTSVNGYLTSTDWTTFNAKQAALSGTGIVKSTAGTISYLTDNTANWDSAYNDKINSASVSGTTTKTLTLTQQDGGTVTASWTDINTDAVSSVFGRTGAVVATSGDYTTAQVTEVTNLYYTDARARASVSGGTGISYNSTTGVITNTITQYTDSLARAAISAGTGISYNSTTGVITNTITQYTDALARAAISLTVSGSSGASTYNSTTGVLNVPTYTLSGLGGQAALSGTGFVKISGTTISYDNSTYLTTSSASSTYLPLAGGTLTGALSGTSATFSGDFAAGGNITSNKADSDTTYIGSQIFLSSTYTGIRSGTDHSFNVDTYNGGSYRNAFKIVQSGAATFSSSVTATAFIPSGATVPTNGMYLSAADTLNFATASTERMRITSSGEILIRGTLNPYTSANRGNITLNGTSSNIITFTNNTISQGYILHQAGTLAIYNETNGTIAFGTNNVERMRITSSGNVGIGTTSPSALLHLQNSAGSTLRLVRTSNRFDISADNDFMEINARDASTYMTFKTADTERMRITSGGNVGIGTTSPSFATGTGLAVFATSADARIALKNTASGDTSTDGFQIVLTTALEAVIENRENASLRFLTNATEAMRITAAGRMLLGTTIESTYILDTVGTARITADSLGLTLKSTLITGNATTTYQADSRTFVTGVGGSLAGYFEARNSYYIFDNNASAVRFYIDSTGAAKFSGSLTASSYFVSSLNTPPTTSSSTGTIGEIRYDVNHIYLCTGTNTWKRAAITTW